MPAETTTLRKEISETRQELGDNLNALEEHLKENWHDVKQQLNPVYQTRQHPWIAVGASVAAGALASSLIASRARNTRPINAKEYSLLDSVNQFPEPSPLGRLFSTVTDRFSEEIELVKNLALAAGVRKVGSLVKKNFPATADAVDEVVQSALTKIDLAQKSPSESGGDEEEVIGSVSVTSFTTSGRPRSFYADEPKTDA